MLMLLVEDSLFHSCVQILFGIFGYHWSVLSTLQGTNVGDNRVCSHQGTADSVIIQMGKITFWTSRMFPNKLDSLTYAAVGWAIWRSDLYFPQRLLFHLDYCGSHQISFSLNFSKSSIHVLGQYYQLIRLGQLSEKLVFAHWNLKIDLYVLAVRHLWLSICYDRINKESGFFGQRHYFSGWRR